MRKLWLIALAFAVGTTVASAANKSFTGQIMDAPCAKEGSHAAGYKMSGARTPRDCTLACARAGAKLVLYDHLTKTIYQLDDQKAAKDFAGVNVKILGSYDKVTDTIHIEKIAATR
jgi:hypothetical protein